MSFPPMASSSLLTPAPLSVQVHRCSSSHSHSHQVLCCIGLTTSFLKKWDVAGMLWRPKPFGSNNHTDWKKRRTLICVANQDAEEAFKKTVEVDRLIDKLRDSNPIELQKLVVQNVLAFNEGFWIRLAARTDTCKSEDDKKDYEELAISIMSIVDRLVHKTYEKIDSATDVLKGVLKPVVDDVEEIRWPPRDPEALKLMEKEIFHREQEGQLDEGFLAEVNAQLRQAKGDGDKPGFEAMLQKVLQLYASTVLSKRSYAKKGDEILKPEKLLETIIKAPEEEWNKLLINGLTIGKGEVSPQELYAVIKKRVERTLIRTEGGSYQQRILTEYLNGIQSRAEQIVQVLQGNL
ncbi:uncharacterized protein LOC126584778 isoform X1 [Malus sylvestris]|uniref:uncharacterized protein LOC126584778 isoform X1 n=1 Tax=Malus sylvestris TaxID=3752 RepID=UPI0021AC3707|nr:uncharacterized protein LOC126584778 isoform X1 [Malus sylvestris]